MALRQVRARRATARLPIEFHDRAEHGFDYSRFSKMPQHPSKSVLALRFPACSLELGNTLGSRANTPIGTTGAEGSAGLDGKQPSRRARGITGYNVN